jgi:hypothetical protein
MNHWESRRQTNGWYATLVDSKKRIVRTHPIPFENEREADRAVARLNDARIGREEVAT